MALEGRLEAHHGFLLAAQLRRLEAIEADIAALDLRIGERLEPYSAPHALLTQIPGVDRVVAAVLIAEIGVDTSVSSGCDLGEAYFDQIGHTRTVANLKRRLERLGYPVTLESNVQPTRRECRRAHLHGS
jgi:hypothetical protein